MVLRKSTAWTFESSVILKGNQTNRHFVNEFVPFESSVILKGNQTNS